MLRCKHTYELPRNNDYKHTLELDKKNGNDNRRDAIQLKLERQQDYDTYKNLCLNRKPPSSSDKICTHFIFKAKHEERYKARLVAGSYLTEVLVSSSHLGVVLLSRIRLVLFLSELNSLES